jgi:predicted GNAT family N-acyltransferase
MKPPFLITTLNKAHDRNAFYSGSEMLDRYLKQQVTQDIRRNLTACFVALNNEKQIAGYYTLSSASIALDALPESLIKQLPRYASLPAARMGRLAVAKTYQGMELGATLLTDAIMRAKQLNREIGMYALLVDAKDEHAAMFYLHHGFIRFTNSPQTLFLPLSQISLQN